MTPSSHFRLVAALLGALLVAGVVLLLRPADEPPPSPPTPSAPPADPSEEARAPEPDPPGSRRVEAVFSVVDGSTGATLRSDWRPLAAGLLSTEAGYASFRIERWTPPADFGGLASIAWDDRIAARAKSARFFVPVYPLADVAIRVVTSSVATPSPLPGAVVEAVRVRPPGIFVDVPTTFETTRSDAAGLLRLRAPRFPDQTLSAWLTRRNAGDEDVFLQAKIVLGARDFDGSLKTVVLAREPGPADVQTGLGWGSDCPGPRPGDEPSAPLVVRAIQGDGRPAAHVEIWCGRGSSYASTDAEGIARFAALPLGATQLIASEPGFLPTCFRADVGRDAEVVVREAPARSVSVVVVDADGRRLPAARVSAGCRSIPGPDGADVGIAACSIAQFDGDVELVGQLTGADGTLKLRAPVGLVRYAAERGGARGDVESSDDLVRIVMKRD